MKYILVTGGPVYAYVDDVKIITNKFKGGLTAKLADDLFFSYRASSGHDCHGCRMWYLSSKDSKQPSMIEKPVGEFLLEGITPLYHDGIADYMNTVLKMAKNMDAIILGAAVANLIPKNRIEGKFPSHNYKPGDDIPITFTIAPRIIDEVKKVNPKVHLFGFKLLSGANHEELIRAAYGVLLESKATTIFANDASDLDTVYAVTKDRSVHKMKRADIVQWIRDRLDEKYYSTETSYQKDMQEKEQGRVADDSIDIAIEKMKKLIEQRKSQFTLTPEGFIFGSIAVRVKENSFITTSRGKNELSGKFSFIKDVNHDNRVVMIDGVDSPKASLNAPLFAHIFQTRKDVGYILHFHEQNPYHKITQKYATPGTDKDSLRDLGELCFNIEGHGCIMCFDKDDRRL